MRLLGQKPSQKVLCEREERDSSDLSALKRRRVATDLCNERVRRFVADG
jgi:hypothetical protein